jgi:hypothetical protein
VATGVGALLVVIWWAIFHNWPDLLFPHLVDCGPNPTLSCGLGGAIVGVILVIGVVVALSVLGGWLLLWLAQLRPAWPVAVAGPIIAGLLTWLTNPITHVLFGQSILRALLPVAVGYGLAGLIIRSRV